MNKGRVSPCSLEGIARHYITETVPVYIGFCRSAETGHGKSPERLWGIMVFYEHMGVKAMWNVRHNATDVSSISAFANIRGGFDGDYKDVSFVRMTGRNASYTDEVGQMDCLLSEQGANGEIRYRRICELPRLAASEDVDYYSGCYDNWTSSGRKSLVLQVSQQNEGLQAALGTACQEAVRLFGQVTPHATASMEKNFAVKLMFWADHIGKELLEDYRPEGNRKLVAPNFFKKQEYLFACFMTLLGVDVLLLQYQADIDGQLEGLGLSKKVSLGEFGACDLPANEPHLQAPAVPPHTERKNTRPARERRPLEVRKAGESGNSIQGSGSRGLGALRTGTGSRASGTERGGFTAPGAGGTGGRRPGNPGMHRTDAAGSGSAVPGRSGRRELDFEELAKLASSVVMISVHDKKGEILGNGSGIMIGEAGYILTNHHVATGGRFYSVRIEDDNTIYKTDEVIKYNSVLDLAVIRIERRLWPLSIYGGGKPLVRGQKVVAIGSPLGLFNSVSDGIISGFRVINDVDMIQFTAPISHGSSGGAVLNMYGEVIGISTAGFDNGQNINLAVGYEFITQFVSGFTGQHGK